MKKLLTNNFKKILSLALLVMLCVTQTAFAQAVADASSTPSLSIRADAGSTKVATSSLVDAPASDTATSTLATSTLTTPASAPPEMQPLVLQGSDSIMQDATTTQPAVTSQVLESTANPETATTTQSVSIPLVNIPTTTDATTTESQPVVPSQNDDPAIPVDQSTTALQVVALAFNPKPATEIPVAVETPQAVPLKDVELSQPNYSFALTGKQIPTQRKVEDKNGAVVGEETVAAALTSQVDNTKGEVALSGQCTNAYFVVLLFKNATDYSDDPRSYIVNRAYPGVGGAFSYSIADLPSSLPNGNYYLLVGEEGSKGSWKPITSQTEITINKN